MSMMDARATAAASASTALLMSSSSEETPGLEFLPSKTSPETRGRSQVDTAQKPSAKTSTKASTKASTETKDRI